MLNSWLMKYQPLFNAEGAGGGGAASATNNAGAPASGAAPAAVDASSSSAGAAPATPSESAEPTTSTNEPSGFDALGMDDLDELAIGEVLGPQNVTETEPPQPGPQATPAQAAPAPAPQQPQAPAAPAAQQPPAAPAAAPPEPAGPQSLVEQLAQNQEELVSALAADRFKLTQQEAEAIELNAVEAIPRLMAKTYLMATQSALMHIQNHVPRMVQRVVKALEDHRKIEDAFYGKFNALDRAKHGGDVNSFSRSFRTANPQISQDDLFAMVGAAVMAKYGLTAQPAAPAAPAQPQVPAFVPARSGVAARITPEPDSPFAGLGQDFDE